MNTHLVKSVLAIAVLAAAAGAHARDLRGTVKSVVDGDSFTIAVDDDPKRLKTVRLAAIDAPEASQPDADAARTALAQLVDGKSVVLTDVHGSDKQPTARLTINGSDIGLEQVKSGHAWYARSEAAALTLQEQGYYLSAEGAARRDRAGLWATPNPTPPWVARARKK